jgi:response regulator of citrate/malate metabolism
VKTFVYYDKKTENIMDFLPSNLSDDRKNTIRELWNQDIPRKILLLLTKEEQLTAPKIKEHIGHSMSTLHENIKKLEMADLIEAEMIYEGNKQKVLKTKVLAVCKNDKLTERITKFLNQGLWVDTTRSNTIIDFLNKHPDKYYTPEEISIKTGIQVDEVRTLLENWDSQLTRGFSHFMRKMPIEKKTLYKAAKTKKK